MSQLRSSREIFAEIEEINKGLKNGTIDPHYMGNSRLKVTNNAITIFGICAGRTDKKSKFIKHWTMEK